MRISDWSSDVCSSDLSSVGMGMLLWSGIGDTIRVSLSAQPEEEVKVGFDILKSLNLRHRGVNVISCPSCARQQFAVSENVSLLLERLAHINTPITVSVIGFLVNAPGEARTTHIRNTRRTHAPPTTSIPSPPH